MMMTHGQAMTRVHVNAQTPIKARGCSYGRKAVPTNPPALTVVCDCYGQAEDTGQQRYQ